METFLYLVLALAVIGALAYALYQVTVRQQRMLAEITRLERLTAEVTISAEALLDEIDQRMARLNQLAAQLEIRMIAEAQAQAEEAAGGETQTEPGAAPAPPKPKRARRARTGFRSQAPATETSPNQSSADQSPESVERNTAPVQPAELAGRSEAIEPASVEPPQPPQAELPETPADRYGDLRQAVWRLADDGRDAVEIAETLGVPRGEVLLLLNLRGRKAARGIRAHWGENGL